MIVCRLVNDLLYTALVLPLSRLISLFDRTYRLLLGQRLLLAVARVYTLIKAPLLELIRGNNNFIKLLACGLLHRLVSVGRRCVLRRFHLAVSATSLGAR